MEFTIIRAPRQNKKDKAYNNLQVETDCIGAITGNKKPASAAKRLGSRLMT